MNGTLSGARCMVLRSFEHEVKRIFILGLMVLALFAVITAAAGAFSYAAEPGDDLDTSLAGKTLMDDSEGSDDLASGTIDAATPAPIPWRITSDYELIIGADGEEYTWQGGVNSPYKQPWYPWIQSEIVISPIERQTLYYHIVKVSFKGTIHLKDEFGWMFKDFTSLKEVDFSGADTSAVTAIDWLFQNCDALESIDFSGLDLGNVVTASLLFGHCDSLKEVDLTPLAASKGLMDIEGMFEDCRALERVDLSGIDTSHVCLMGNMFKNCESLTEVDLSGFDTSSVYTDEKSTSLRKNKTIFSDSGIKRIALGEKSLFPETSFVLGYDIFKQANNVGEIRRYKTLDGEPVDSPTYADLKEYDGSAPGWYMLVEDDPGTGDDPGSGEDPGTGTDPGTTVDPGTGDDPGTTVEPGSGTEPGTGEDPGTTVEPGTGDDPGTTVDPGTGDDPSSQEDPGKTQSDTTDKTDKTPARKAITSVSIGRKDFDYTGKKIKPQVKVKYRNTTLKKGRDYKVLYGNNTKIGKGTVVVKGIGKYKGTFYKKFRIIPDRAKAKVEAFKIVEGTQMIITVKSKCKAKAYEFMLAKDKKFKHVIAHKKLGKNDLMFGKIYAYKHLKNKKRYYVRVRAIAKNGTKGKYSKTVKFKGLG